jgi:O-antigen/teichoic acid export membrane protein
MDGIHLVPTSMPTETPTTPTPATVDGRQPRVVRNVFSNWGSYVVATGVSFFLSPYVVRHLGNTAYGVWTLILALTGYLGLLDLGVRGAVTRYVARFHTQADHERASNVASSAMVIFSTAGLLAILTSALLAGLVVGRLDIPPQFMTAARFVLLITGLNVATSLINGVYGGILVGLQRFDLTNSIEVSINVLRAAATVLSLHLGYGIKTLAVIQLGFTLIRWMANIFLVHRLYPQLKIYLSLADRAGVKLIFSFSVFSFLLHVSGSLIYASDNVVIGAYLPATAVTFYVIGGNLIEYTRTLVAGISQTMTPLASSTEARNDDDRVRMVVLVSSRAASMAVFPIAITFMLRGSSFISLWMDPQYGELSGKVLWILSLTLMLWAANSVTAGSLLGLSKHKPIVPILLAEGVCNLALSIYWVKRMGIVGVAWGTLVPSLFSSVLFWPWYVQRAVGIKSLQYAYSAWIRPAIAIVPFAAGSYAVERYWPAGNLFIFFLQVALALPFALAGYWLVCLNAHQRESIRRSLSQSLSRAFARG